MTITTTIMPPRMRLMKFAALVLTLGAMLVASGSAVAEDWKTAMAAKPSEDIAAAFAAVKLYGSKCDGGVPPKMAAFAREQYMRLLRSGAGFLVSRAMNDEHELFVLMGKEQFCELESWVTKLDPDMPVGNANTPRTKP